MSTAGLPQDKSVKWTYLKPDQISEQLVAQGLKVSSYQARQMLDFRAYKKRSLLKMSTLKEVEGRDEQFKKIASYRAIFAEQGLPIISIDTKKKEFIGDMRREGTVYAVGERHVPDHSFQTKDSVQIVPHGIYDVSDNTGYITLGTSKDTSEFICDNLEASWTQFLQYKYVDKDTMLLLCDGGGSNASAHYIVKQDLLKLAKRLNINILVAHYPPYCSKWNPIEHRLFSQITHTWSGTPLFNIEFVKELTDTTTTKTGLKVITSINEKKYLTKREVPQEFKDNLKDYIQFDDKNPKLNYLIKGRF